MAEASVTKSVMETYTVRNGFERATIAVRCWSRPVKRHDDKPDDTYHCGEILINSSFGSWANTWTACGCPFKEFLTEVEFDYAFGKFMGASLRIYDGERTVRKLRSKIIDERRTHALDRDQARAVWDAIEENETELESSSRDYCECMWRIARDLGITERSRHPLWGEFTEPFYCTEDCYDPQPVGFWREIWPHFIAELKRELAGASSIAGVSASDTSVPDAAEQGDKT